MSPGPFHQPIDLLFHIYITVMAPAHSRDLRFGDLSLCIWPPEEAYYEKDNDYSLAVLVRHGGVKMFFAGDAQKRRMKELLTYSALRSGRRKAPP